MGATQSRDFNELPLGYVTPPPRRGGESHENEDENRVVPFGSFHRHHHHHLTHSADMMHVYDATTFSDIVLADHNNEEGRDNHDDDDEEEEDDDDEKLDLERVGSGERRRALMPLKFEELRSRSHVGLCSQGLRKLSPNVGLLDEAVCLQLCCNALSRLPSEIGYLKQLAVLDLSRNQIEHLPSSIGYLQGLVELRLSHNRLTNLPSSLVHLEKLTHFALDHNDLAVVPSWMGRLCSLIELDLSGNPVKVVPAELGRLVSLRRLTLGACPLVTEFKYEQINSPPSLRELAARKIVSSHVPILKRTPAHLKAYMQTVQYCSFCRAPYFETCVKRGRMRQRGGYQIPLEYRLCCAHWTTEEERIAVMFAPPYSACDANRAPVVGTMKLKRAPVSHVKQMAHQEEQQQQQQQQQQKRKSRRAAAMATRFVRLTARRSIPKLTLGNLIRRSVSTQEPQQPPQHLQQPPLSMSRADSPTSPTFPGPRPRASKLPSTVSIAGLIRTPTLPDLPHLAVVSQTPRMSRMMRRASMSLATTIRRAGMGGEEMAMTAYIVH